MSFFVAEAVAQTQSAPPPQSGLFQIVMLVGLFALMYFMLIRPQRKRQKEHQQLISALAKGDEVVLTSGMLGKVTDVGEVYITVDVGNEVKLKFQKVAVHAVLPKGTIKSI
ncbi:preprotein translocase subunit YajC [Saccharophagus sp. K07]|uniref:preprotein translocase subunit YajC n=1 Tax=Saccharophagus sp. K07 TaxID=2283636 RepID=UPI001652438D|nr:preprotein translocase subunit YajC [Saccharophagus sp. K07]MBC6904889.1 preprotein translocase subunit YajC [Saccharophagus sp. K07]